MRLIPARAGNTAWLRMRTVSTSAHPRSRGEHGAPGRALLLPLGSSPLARGTPRTSIVSRLQMRLIPARAGNTTLQKELAAKTSAHPRSRGEHQIMRISIGVACGSSPLARGTQHVNWVLVGYLRLIPARAGNTNPRHRLVALISAHPRSRGEHDGAALRVEDSRGSSPLARGTLTAHSQAVDKSRLIPARAGNTPIRTPPRVHISAHPRSRGEHGYAVDGLEFQLGSSPLARGTRLICGRHIAVGRLIPARAGNTHRQMLRPTR